MAEPFVARSSMSMAIVGFFCGFPFFAVAALGPEYFGLTPKDGWEIIRWPTLAFGALGMIGSVRSLFDDRIQVQVDDSGILIRGRPELIPWSAIARVRVARQYIRWLFYNRLVAFDLHDPSQFPSRSLYFRLTGRSPALGMGDFVISGVNLDCTTDALLAAIKLRAPPGVELSDK